MAAEFSVFLGASQTRVNNALSRLIPESATEATRLQAAMRYSLLSGGKRIRPALVYAGAAAAGKNDLASLPAAVDTVACAIECIHAYSLIHDDLPAMDDDPLRRGKPTCHIAFDEALAILAGDALQTLAFDIISNETGLSAEARLRIVQLFANAAGQKGMVEGQARDIEAQDTSLDLIGLEQMHNGKTGALITAAIVAGGICGSLSDNAILDQLEEFGRIIGLAFQVQDDILDVTSATETLGKRQGSDAEHAKVTYVSLLGLDGAEAKAHELVRKAHEIAQPLGKGAELLCQLADYTIARSH